MNTRKSIRLKGYDYSKAGAYFITICTKDMQCFFGEILEKEMILNDLGKIVEECWLEIPEHFKNVVLHEYVVMPNHFHGILVLRKSVNVRPPHVVAVNDNDSGVVGSSYMMTLPDDMDLQTEPPHVVAPQAGVAAHKSYKMPAPRPQSNKNQFSKPIPGSVSVIIQQYKAAVKRWSNKNDHKYFQWHSKFYDHIIRNEASYDSISNYIVNNPGNWKDDKFFKK